MTTTVDRPIVSPADHVTTPRGVLIFANPFSGSGPNRKRVHQLEAALQGLGLAPHIVWSREERHTFLTDPTLPERVGCVVSAGGDGSLSDVLTGLHAAGTLPQLILYHYPVGTENLFAAEVQHTRDPQQAANAIAHALSTDQTPARHRTIDLGQATADQQTQLFHLMLSAGFDAEVVRRMDRWRTAPTNGRLRRVTRTRYAPRTLAALAHYRYPPVQLTPDDGTTLTGAHAFVFNLPRYGGGLKLGSAADYTDGQLDYLVLTRPGLPRLLRYGITVLLNRHHHSPHIYHGRTTQLTLHTEAPIQLDGDRLPPPNDHRVTITAKPDALRICVPT
ncbi:MAG: diacylglycerol kinase family protein [Planctomycetota bacterium]